MPLVGKEKHKTKSSPANSCSLLLVSAEYKLHEAMGAICSTAQAVIWLNLLSVNMHYGLWVLKRKRNDCCTDTVE